MTSQREYFTPPHVIAAARTVLGSIDLDPASSDGAQQFVQAATYFTPDRDGLEQEWAGRVWLNPPFGAESAGRFIDKLLHSPEVISSIVVSTPQIDRLYLRPLLMSATAICIPEKRIRFFSPSGEAVSVPAMFWYCGANSKRFETFFGFGRIGVVRRLV